MKAIELNADGSYALRANGCDMTLRREGDQWVMYSLNAMVRAYRNGYAIPKFFASLADVEAKYKAWRGIAALAGEGVTA